MNDSIKSDDDFLSIRHKDFFERSLCAFIITDSKGILIENNAKLEEWIEVAPGELVGNHISNLFSIGSKIYYETHLGPLLKMQSYFDEVLVELNTSSGQKLRVLINALERKDQGDRSDCIYFVLSKSTDRLQYEQNLKLAKKMAENELQNEKKNVQLREQLIAVLGHDLRNPLNAITIAVEMLGSSEINEQQAELVDVIKRSGHRMAELIKNIMDFARSWLGEGIILSKEKVDIRPMLDQVIAELKLAYPESVIIEEIEIDEPILCDPYRISQLLSNLLVNAITHGISEKPVKIRAVHNQGVLRIEIINNGEKIPDDFKDLLFSPFAKKHNKLNQNGLGLGLYISSEIARAHEATLSFTSTDIETCFTVEMSTGTPN